MTINPVIQEDVLPLSYVEDIFAKYDRYIRFIVSKSFSNFIPYERLPANYKAGETSK